MITAANKPPKLPTDFIAVTKENNPTPTFFIPSEFAKMSAIKYSFHTLRNKKIPTVIKPGCAKGSIIVQNVLIGEHPSNAAASSYVLDSVPKKFKRKVVAKGTLIQT